MANDGNAITILQKIECCVHVTIVQCIYDIRHGAALGKLVVKMV